MVNPEAKHSITTIRRRLLPFVAAGAIITLLGPACASQPATLVTPDRRNATAVPTTVAVGPTITPTILTSEPKKEATLASLVANAKKIEDEFKGQNLSDKTIRSQYTSLLADIFTRYYPIGASREQLSSSVVFVDSKKEFEETYVKINQDPNSPTPYLRKQANETAAITADGKIYINAAHEVFQKQETAKNPYYPKDWHPLKTLRLALFHEFNHLITQPAEDAAISAVVDPRNDITNKEIDGFAIKGFNSKKELVGLYGAIDEASAELSSKYINFDLFGSFLSDYSTDTRVTPIMIRLEKLLDAAKISKIEFTYLHKTSNLKGLLLLLTERYGINPQRISERDRIGFGLSLFEALMRDNQAILQDYMNSAKRFVK